MIMVNLMIAVILEAFSDSSSNELVEVIDCAIRIWPQYDHDLVLKASLPDTFRFVHAVALDHGVDLSIDPDCNHDQAERLRKLAQHSKSFLSCMKIGHEHSGQPEPWSMAEVPMRIAKLCETKVLPDGRVHFLYAVRMAVALTLSANSNSVL